MRAKQIVEATASQSPVVKAKSKGASTDLVALTSQVRALGFEIVSREVLNDLRRRATRSSGDRKALVRIFGLLTHRHWWNSNTWAARQIAMERLLDTGAFTRATASPPVSSSDGVAS